MKIYTRTGDNGETGLFGGARVKKNHLRVEVYGTIDELNALLGVARAAHLPAELDRPLELMQAELFVIGSELACDPEKIGKLPLELITSSASEALERLIDETEAHLPPLKNFILPAGSPAGAALHHARTVARRAERRLLDLEAVRPEVLIYLNRLSDCLFVLARRANQLDDTPETPWMPRAER
jgi:cob(I)alamin adenosyltransferase